MAVELRIVVKDAQTGIPVYGARVYFLGREVIADHNGVAVFDLEVGTRSLLEITHPYYDTYSQEIRTADSGISAHTIELNPTSPDTHGSVGGAITNYYTDEPVGSVRIRLYAGDMKIEDITTGGNGIYLFENLSPGPYRLQFDKTDYYDKSIDVNILPRVSSTKNIKLKPTEEPPNGEPPNGEPPEDYVVFWGFVVKLGTQERVPGVLLHVYHDRTTETADATTNANGEFELAPLPPIGDKWKVTMSKEGFGSKGTTIGRTDRGVLLDPIGLGYDMIPVVVQEYGGLAGVVTDINTGEVIQGAEVKVFVNDVVVGVALTISGGVYNFDSLPAGAAYVQVSKEGYASESKNVTIVSLSTVALDFALVPLGVPPQYGVVIHVTDAATGGPLTDFTVALYKDGVLIEQSSSGPVDVWSVGVTDAGDYTVTISKAGYTTLVDQPIVVLPQTLNNFEFALTSGAPGAPQLKILVKDSVTGSPLQLVTVSLIELGNVIATGTTGADGTYDFGPRNPGAYELKLEKTGYTTLQQAFSHGTETPVPFEWELVSTGIPPGQGQLKFWVMNSATGDPILGVSITLMFQGVEIATGTTDSSGMYDFGIVEFGEYNAEFVRGGYRTSTVVFEHNANTPVPKTVLLVSEEEPPDEEEIGNLVITVVHKTDGTPIQGASVALTLEGVPISTLNTDAQGEVYFAAIPIGTHRYQIEKPGFITYVGYHTVPVEPVQRFTVELGIEEEEPPPGEYIHVIQIASEADREAAEILRAGREIPIITTLKWEDLPQAQILYLVGGTVVNPLFREIYLETPFAQALDPDERLPYLESYGTFWNLAETKEYVIYGERRGYRIYGFAGTHAGDTRNIARAFNRGELDLEEAIATGLLMQSTTPVTGEHLMAFWIWVTPAPLAMGAAKLAAGEITAREYVRQYPAIENLGSAIGRFIRGKPAATVTSIRAGAGVASTASKARWGGLIAGMTRDFKAHPLLTILAAGFTLSQLDAAGWFFGLHPEGVRRRASEMRSTLTTDIIALDEAIDAQNWDTARDLVTTIDELIDAYEERYMSDNARQFWESMGYDFGDITDMLTAMRAALEVYRLQIPGEGFLFPEVMEGVVTLVRDGDTFEMSRADTEETIVIRLLGIDAPEMNTGTDVCRFAARAAKAALEALILGQVVSVRTDPENLYDVYGRVLGVVSKGDIGVNYQMRQAMPGKIQIHTSPTNAAIYMTGKANDLLLPVVNFYIGNSPDVLGCIPPGNYSFGLVYTGYESIAITGPFEILPEAKTELPELYEFVPLDLEFRSLTLSMIKDFYKHGIFSREEAVGRLIGLDYSPDDAALIIDSINLVIPGTPLPRTLVEELFRTGVLSRSEAIEKLMELGYSEENAGLILDTVFRGQPLAKSEVEALYEAGLITRADAISRLQELGYSSEDAELLISLITVASPDTPIPRSIVEDLYSRGIITYAEAIGKLVQLGFSEEDAALILALLEPEVPPPDVGDVRVTSSPSYAAIYVNTVFKQLYTSETLKNLLPGTYNITLKKSGYEDWTGSVNVVGGQTVEIHGELTEIEDEEPARLTREIIENLYASGLITYNEAIAKLMELGFTEEDAAAILSLITPELRNVGDIKVNSNPTGAKIYLDGVFLQLYTSETLDDIPIGMHIIRLEKAGYHVWTGSVEVIENETVEILAELLEIEVTLTTGSLKISSTPSNAKIYVDDIDSGFFTPETIEVDAGSHTVKLFVPGYEEWTTEAPVAVEAGKTREIHGTMIVSPAPLSKSIIEDLYRNGLISYEIALTKLMELDFTREDAAAILSLITPRLRNVGSVRVNSSPTGAKIYIDGIFLQLYTSETLENIPVGSHTVRLEKSGYVTWTGPVNVAEDSLVEVFAELEEIEEIPTIASLKISSSPSNAKIYIDGVDTGFFTSETIGVNPGPHTVRLSLSGHVDWTTEAPVSVEAGKTKEVHGELEEVAPNTGALHIVSEPSYATILIDDVFSGFFTAETISDLTPGRHKITLIKEDYGSVDVFVDVVVGETREVFGKLAEAPIPLPRTLIESLYKKGIISFEEAIEKLMLLGFSQEDSENILALLAPDIDIEAGKIRVTSDPSEAKIYLDGIDQQVFTPETLNDIPIGSHVVRVELGDHHPFSQSIDVVKDKTVEVIATLSPILEPRRVGEIKVTSSPSGATIFLDGQDLTLLTPQTLEVDIGSHQITLQLAGHETWHHSAAIDISEGSYKEIHANLIPFPSDKGSLNIQSSPSHAKILFDGEVIYRYTPETLNSLDPGLHTIRLEKPGYNFYADKIQVTAGTENEFYAEMTKIPVAPPPPTRPPAPPLPPPETGTIEVVSEPAFARIFLDEVDTGRTTKAYIFGVAPGVHVVRVEKIGFPAQNIRVTVRAGETVRIYFDLRKPPEAPPEVPPVERPPEVPPPERPPPAVPGVVKEKLVEAYLVVNSIPEGAGIFINGVYTGRQASELLKILVDEGGTRTIEVTCVKSGFKNYVETTELTPRRVANIIANMTQGAAERLEIPSDGTLNVDSTPEGAKIYVDGISTELWTPQQLRIPSGAHVVHLIREDYQQMVQPVNVPSLGAADVSVDLVRL